MSTGFPLFKFKGLSEVKVLEDGSFKFQLPIRALGKDIRELKFKATIKDGERIILSEAYTQSSISIDKTSSVLVEGKIEDFRISSHIDLVIEWSEQTFSHEIALVRNMLNVEGKESKKLPFRDSEVLVNNNGRLSSALRKVVTNKFDNHSLDYFVQRNPTTAGTTLIELARITTTDIKSVSVEIPEVGKLISVIKNDFNNDGEEDYMVYSLAKEEKHLVLSFVKADGTALYGEVSQWFLEISTFEGLPFFNGEIRFELLNTEFKGFGKVKTPVFMKNWLMPEADNSRDPLDRVGENVASNKPYFLNPVVLNNRVDLEIRTLESLRFRDSLRERFSISDREPVAFDHLFEQDKDSRSLDAVIVSGSEFSKRYFHITYSSVEAFNIEEIYFYGLSLDSNRTLVSRSNTFQYNASFALNSRQELRTVFWDLEGERSVSDFKTGSWGDLIIDIFDFSKNEDDNLVLLESRYFIHAISDEGTSQKLPINRESSFPGVSFSETFKKVHVDLGEAKARGILVDSSLIYGDRLYSMVYSNGVFSSPLFSSFSVPKNCKYLDVSEFEKGSYVVLACHDKFLRSTLELIPLKERVK